MTGPYHVGGTPGDDHWARDVRDRNGHSVAWCGSTDGVKHAKMIVDALNEKRERDEK